MSRDDSLPIPIDFVGDVVCAECFIGLRLIDAVVASVPGLTVDIRWHPFQIDPEMPMEGQDRRSYLESAYGSNEEIAAALEPLVEISHEFGLDLAFDKIKRQPNTFAAHRLIGFASRFGTEMQMLERLFYAFFRDGQDIGDRSVLIALAAQARLDPVVVAQFLKGDDGVAGLKQQLADIRATGVQEAPRFTFAGKQTLAGLKSIEDIADALFGSIEDE